MRNVGIGERARRPVAVLLALLLAGVAAALAAQPVLAHAMEVEQSRGEAVEVVAAYDNGDPVNEGQVLVYAPGGDSEPWATGTTDEEGRYVFMPDASQPGEWEIRAQQAGHGASTSVEVEEASEDPGEEARAGGGSGEDTGTEEGSGDEAQGEEARAEEVSGEGQAAQGGGDTMQRVLMGGAVIWGFIGTALFFSRRRR